MTISHKPPKRRRESGSRELQNFRTKHDPSGRQGSDKGDPRSRARWEVVWTPAGQAPGQVIIPCLPKEGAFTKEQNVTALVAGGHEDTQKGRWRR